MAERLALGRGGVAGSALVYLGGSPSLPSGLRVERAEFLATIVIEDSRTPMAAYVEDLEQPASFRATTRKR